MMKNAAVMESGNDWAVAGQVQQRFIEHTMPAIEILDYGARCRQLHTIGGDCYDFLPLPENRLVLAIGDASGKGLPAAFMIANVQSSLRTAASFAPDDGATVLTVVNRHVHASSSADRFATLFYGVFDQSAQTLRYVNAGHNPPMVLRGDGSITWLEAGGAPVGMFSDWIYEEGSAQLNSGDVLLAYTDGVIEATNPAGEEWGLEGLQRATRNPCAQSAGEIVDVIFTAMDEFTHNHQSDDATVLALRVK